MSRGFGQSLQLTERELKALQRAGRVHDIGKIAIPDAILFKSGPLTTEEFTIVKEHPDKGFRLLKAMRTFDNTHAGSALSSRTTRRLGISPGPAR